MKNILFTILLGFYALMLGGQDRTVDSLKAVLNLTGQDTNRVNVLLELSTYVFRGNPNEAVIYSQEAEQLSKELSYQKGEALALKNKGLAYYIKGDYEEVLDYWEQSLAIFRKMEDQAGVSNLLNNLGAVYFNRGNNPEALKNYLASLTVAEELHDSLRKATALSNIGAVYLESPAFHYKALEYYSEALPMSIAIGDQDAIGTTAVNMGEIYLAKGDYDKALRYFNQSLKAYEQTNGNISYSFNNIAKVYLRKGEYQKAIEFQEKAYQSAESKNALLEITQARIGLGNSYLGLGIQTGDQADFAKAFEYFKQAFEDAQLEDEGANDRQEDAEDKKLKPEIMEAAKGLYQYYKNQGNYIRALEYHEVFEATKDSLLNDENINQIAVLSAEHGFEKEKQSLEVQRLELDAKFKRQRTVQIATAAGLFVAVVFILILIQYYKLKRIRAKEKYEAQRQLLMQEKLANLGQLTAGIAHEIKNPLNFVTNFAEGSIELTEELNELLEENKDKLQPDQLDLFKGLAEDLNQNAEDIRENGMRADRIVQSMMEQARGGKGEMQMVDLNALINENVNLAYHGYRAIHPNFYINVQKEYDPSLTAVEAIPQDLGRVILNIFNNAFYALYQWQKEMDESYKPTLRVVTQGRGGDLVIRIRDNGPGIPESLRNKIFNPFFTTKPTGEGNTGLGLSISYDIIVQGHKGRLEVDSDPGKYTEFIIILPGKKARMEDL